MTGPITLVGSFPPPYGGVSVHIKRLKRCLEARGIPVEVLADPGSGDGSEGVVPRRLGPAWYAGRLRRKGAGLIHFHTSGIASARLVSMSLLAASGRPVVVTLHSLRDPCRGPRRLLFRLASRALRSFQHVVCVGPDIRDAVLERGVPPERISVIPSYLPPDRNDAERRRIEPEVKRFLESHRPLLTASAYRLVFYNGEDLYGLDLCVDLCRRLIGEHPDLGFVFALPEIGEPAYYESIRKRIAASGLERHFCFSRAAAEYWPIIERASLLVRPTNTDSYGVSVMEAIALGVPAIASDVCPRAPGATLFRSRDLDDLVDKTRGVLADLDRRRRDLTPGRADTTGAIEPILAVYRRALGQPGPAFDASAGAGSEPSR